MRVLYVTTIGPTMSFFYEQFKYYKDNDIEISLACCLDRPVEKKILDLCSNVYNISFSRSPLARGNFFAFKQLRNIIDTGSFDIIHCHTPIAAAITRIVSRKYRKKGLKVFYTAHGFHFYKGAPLLNWLVYYPIEKMCSRYTDKLVTINQEDYQIAKKNFHVNDVYYIPGVGIDVDFFIEKEVNRSVKRGAIGLPEDSFVFLSVGELNANKNHEIVLRSLALMNNPKVHYIIAGEGENKEYLLTLAEKLGISKNVHLLGFRKDVAELYKIADIYILPSKREGLNVSIMEAMASGKPCVVSKIRGNLDLIDEGGGVFFNPYDIDDCYCKMEQMMSADVSSMSGYNIEKVHMFSTKHVLECMKEIYEFE